MDYKPKFRAFELDTGIMYYNICPTPEKDTIHLFFENGGFEELLGNFKIMQWAWVFDIKGREIYAGDIVELQKSRGDFREGKKFVIKFDEKELCFYAVPLGVKVKDPKKLRITKNKDKVFLIIGNVFENSN